MSLDERSDSAAYGRALAALQGLPADGTVLVTAYVPPSAGSGPEALPEQLRDLLERYAPAERTEPVRDLRSPWGGLLSGGVGGP